MVYLPTILFALGEGAVIPLIPVLAVSMGADVAFAALVASALVIGQLCGNLPAGWAVRRIGERFTMVIAGVIAIIAGVGMVFAPSLGVLAAYMSLLFAIATALRNNGVADVGYGGAFIVVITTGALLMPPTSMGVLGLVLLPYIWGTRLVLRIYHKNLGKPEDFRYKAWRDAWGSNFMLRSFLQVYMLQGLVVFVVALPVLLAIVFPGVVNKSSHS